MTTFTHAKAEIFHFNVSTAYNWRDRAPNLIKTGQKSARIVQNKNQSTVTSFNDNVHGRRPPQRTGPGPRKLSTNHTMSMACGRILGISSGTAACRFENNNNYRFNS
jgi:hypothetical protein